ERQMELLVKREDHRADRVGPGIAPLRTAIIRVDQLDLVAGFGQGPDQLAQRPRHAIDLGEVRFGDDCDAHHPSSRSTGGRSVAAADQTILTDAKACSQRTLLVRSKRLEVAPLSCRTVRDMRNSDLEGVFPPRCSTWPVHDEELR